MKLFSLYIFGAAFTIWFTTYILNLDMSIGEMLVIILAVFMGAVIGRL